MDGVEKEYFGSCLADLIINQAAWEPITNMLSSF